MTAPSQNTISQQRWPITEPTLYDVLQMHKQDIFSSLRVCVPAQIVSFDVNKRTATVQILLTRTLSDGRTVAPYPQINDVPVQTPQGGGAYLQFPISAGDQGILLFADRNIRAWLQNGTPAPLPTQRMHSLSDGFFIPGINAVPSTMPAYPTNKVVLGYAGNQLEITATGWNIVGDGGAEIDLAGEIITLKNATTTLNTLLGLLITAIEAIQVTGNLPLTAPSVAALEVVRTELATLLG